MLSRCFLTLLYISNYFTYTTISETVTLSIVLWVFSGYVSNKANRVAARHFEKVTQKVVSWSILPVPKEAGKHGSIFRGVTLLGHNKWYKAGLLKGRGINNNTGSTKSTNNSNSFTLYNIKNLIEQVYLCGRSYISKQIKLVLKMNITSQNR